MRPEHPHRYPDIDEHLVPGPESGGSIREMSRSSTLWTNEASFYCSSIKQRERKYFRQLIFCSQDLWASLRGSACLHDHSTSCQNRSTPNFNEPFYVNSQQTTVNCFCQKVCKVTFFLSHIKEQFTRSFVLCFNKLFWNNPKLICLLIGKVYNWNILHK